MQTRFIKDFAIALIFIVLIVLGVKLFMEQRTVKVVPDKSIYTKESVSDSLMNKIKTIENSIQDRKMFAFSVTRDPLRQGNIIKDKVDREKEFQQMVLNTFRLATTAIDENGNKIAYLEYQGRTYEGRIGQSIEGRKILDIGQRKITYSYNGSTYNLDLAARPVMPKDKDSNDISNYNY
ncbi:MAG: hypothetical protein CVU48_09945 [Candidatus Cloacimonetes bacterium HGW-Cloacimonetes-1]|jgi:hypothetical protein|nr:MAG: hypothetical protein CVU48_09945 [Candidatus Cloacimonetes bacterium HGW-Cloacimonetes-1]